MIDTPSAQTYDGERPRRIRIVTREEGFIYGQERDVVGWLEVGLPVIRDNGFLLILNESDFEPVISPSPDQTDTPPPGPTDATDAHDSAKGVLQLPAVPTPEVLETLGIICFQASPVAEIYRLAGHAIRHRAEDEQAFVIFRALQLALRHGPDWRDRMSDEMDAILGKQSHKAADAP